MGLESNLPGYIADLDKTWPLTIEDVSQGDNHIRYIKNVLKNTFPGELGQGFNEPILATEAEINALQGVSQLIQPQLDAANTKPVCIVVRDFTDYPTIPANTPTTVAYNTVIYDSHNAWDNLVAEYAVPLEGIYRVHAVAAAPAAGTITRVTLFVVKGSTTIRQFGTDAGGTFAPHGHVTGLVECAIGDVLSVKISYSGGSGGVLATPASTYMEIDFIRPV